jgi:stage III sporulation protein AD
MTLFWKATAAVLIALILILTMGKQEKDLGLLLNIAVCCMTATALLQILEPVIKFLESLRELTSLDSSALTTMLKLCGIGLVSELVCLLCNDAGCSSLGKSLHLLGSGLMLYLSIPIMETLLSTIRSIMGGL